MLPGVTCSFDAPGVDVDGGGVGAADLDEEIPFYCQAKCTRVGGACTLHTTHEISHFDVSAPDWL